MRRERGPAPAHAGGGRATAGNRRLWRTLATAALACAATAMIATSAYGAEYIKEYEHAYEVGVQGYIYGEPLLNMQRLFQSNTSVTVPDAIGDAPVNQWSHFTELATTKEGEIVSPNADTLYSYAWLSLKPQPIVVHVPVAGRFNVVPIMTPYEENIGNIGEDASGMLPPGNYVIATGKKYAGKEEVDGMKVVHSPYSRVWLVARTVVNSKEDTANAAAIQAEEKLVPLKSWKREGLSYTPPVADEEVTKPIETKVPGTQPGEEPLTYWTALGAAMKQFKPPAADAPELALLKSVGIGPGKSPANDPRLSAGTLAGLRAAVTAGPGVVYDHLKELVLQGFEKHNGWAIVPVGNYGTNYVLRAVIDQDGLAGLPANIAIYPFATTERHGVPLNGAATRYVAHFPASDFPVPVQAFWSMTMYSTSGYFVPNALERFTLGNRSNLQYEDGALNVYIQSEEPTSEAEQDNWLPAPAGPFQLIMRLYGTEEASIEPILEGTGSWKPPTILPCLEDGKTAAGWSCAS